MTLNIKSKLEEVSFKEGFEGGQVRASADGFGKGVPEGGGSDSECSVAPGLVLGHGG